MGKSSERLIERLAAAIERDEITKAEVKRRTGFSSSLLETYLRAESVPGLDAAISTSSGGSSTFIFSGRVGTGLFADPSGLFSLGLFISHASSSSSAGSTKVDGSSTPVLAELITRKAFGTGLYGGARIGIGLESATVSTGTSSASASAVAFDVGPVLGYEFPIIPNLAADFDAGWLESSGVTFNFPGGSVQTGSAGAITLQGGVTYHW